MGPLSIPTGDQDISPLIGSGGTILPTNQMPRMAFYHVTPPHTGAQMKNF